MHKTHAPLSNDCTAPIAASNTATTGDCTPIPTGVAMGTDGIGIPITGEIVPSCYQPNSGCVGVTNAVASPQTFTSVTLTDPSPGPGSPSPGLDDMWLTSSMLLICGVVIIALLLALHRILVDWVQFLMLIIAGVSCGIGIMNLVFIVATYLK